MYYRVAFASTGKAIDQHFGSARYFQVYDIDGGESRFFETRKITAKGQNSCEGGFDQLLAALSDCNAVFTLKIGRSAAAFMISRGVRVFEATGEVEEIAARLIAEDILGE
ncbi:putative Fe-Mo cluster-binding NifX family protein [Ruminiclostridium sufflavum DSM 19573]|uniref:Putative Fe-Mo cluster-binding NifX family protein n=1 Tax=Ruminiclostridium sufflavum DSM 19573 TaxID=1121337 RepID=A0A318XNQ2_9FIRM|nr:NifB/NifX family molybdenum-iron cluster-binding protein [Ruminiclostridium sufflavum]PYG88541.1 putative Fe-Mo cluster-binding NifX family protein [Ruminiclostridium sufflavum DSM 19573]